LVGLNVGYKDKYQFGAIGLDASGTIFKGINKNESDYAKLTIYKVQAAAILPVNDVFSINGGLNVSYFSNSGDDQVKYEPAAGIDLGIQVDVKNVGIMVGTQFLGLNMKRTDVDAKLTGYYDGFFTQVSYMF
jgi:hypothetical protein